MGGGEGIMLSKIVVKEREIPYNFINRWKLKNKIKEEIFHQTDRYRDGTGGVRGHQGWGLSESD